MNVKMLITHFFIDSLLTFSDQILIIIIIIIIIIIYELIGAQLNMRMISCALQLHYFTRNK